MTRVPLGVPVITPARGCNCAVCPFFIDNPDAVEPVCSGSLTSCAYCGCARTEGANPTPDTCRSCSVRCGSRIDIDDWMRDIGGTVLFDDLALDDDLTIPDGFPRFVPMLDGDTLPEFHSAIHWGAYALGLRRIFSPVTHTMYPRYTGRTAREFLELDDDQMSMLVMYGEDPLVEGWWTHRDSRGLTDLVVEQEWDVVLAPNHSLYLNQPRAEHLINFRRNLLLAQELSDRGVTVAPNLYWARLEDLRRYTDWIADTNPPVIASNMQTIRWDDWWDDMVVPGLHFIAQEIDDAGVDTKIVLNGLSRASRINLCLDLFGDRLIVVSQNPLQLARRGAVMTASGRDDRGLRPGDAFAASVEFYDDLVSGRVVSEDDSATADEQAPSTGGHALSVSAD